LNAHDVLDGLVEEDKLQLLVIGSIVFLLHLFHCWYQFFKILNFLILSGLELEDVGEVNGAVSFSHPEVDLKQVMHFVMEPKVVLLGVEPVFQHS